MVEWLGHSSSSILSILQPGIATAATTRAASQQGACPAALLPRGLCFFYPGNVQLPLCLSPLPFSLHDFALASLCVLVRGRGPVFGGNQCSLPLLVGCMMPLVGTKLHLHGCMATACRCLVRATGLYSNEGADRPHHSLSTVHLLLLALLVLSQHASPPFLLLLLCWQLVCPQL